MKQKVVIRLQMEDSKKRSKAMKLAVGLPGVLSAAIEGADKNMIVVVGEGVDSITLTTLLRKHMGNAELISVAAVDKKEEKEEKKGEKEDSSSMATWPSHGGVYPYPVQYHYVTEARQHYYQDPSCCIM